MSPIVFKCTWFILLILMFRRTQNEFCNKTRPCIAEHERTSQTYKKKKKNYSPACMLVYFYNSRVQSVPMWADLYWSESSGETLLQWPISQWGGRGWEPLSFWVNSVLKSLLSTLICSWRVMKNISNKFHANHNYLLDDLCRHSNKTWKYSPNFNFFKCPFLPSVEADDNKTASMPKDALELKNWTIIFGI